MIPYSSMTLKQASDEVMLRISQQRTASNIDWGTVVLCINRARRETLAQTLAMKYWSYMVTVAITHRGVQGQAGGVPPTYIRSVRCLLHDPGSGGELREARYADPKEFHTLADWRRGHQWARATIANPIYTLWGSSDPSEGLVFYAAPNADHQTGTPPPGAAYYTGAPPAGVLDCLAGPPELVNEPDVLGVPPEYENAVILGATARCLAKLRNRDGMVEIQRRVIAEHRKLRERNQELEETQHVELKATSDR